MTPRKVYLDNAATTQLDPRVAAAMSAAEQTAWGNSSSVHGAGTAAARAVERARMEIASRMGVSPDEIIFTSGGTESNNLAILGLAFARKPAGFRVAFSAVEHPSVSEPARWLGRLGAKVVRIPVDERGLIKLPALENALKAGLDLVSVMHANNEVGTVQPVVEIASLCRRHGAVFHTDACQSFGKLPLEPAKIGAGLVSVNAHKIHGPKGVGALYARKGLKFDAIYRGGGQEGGLRSGTLNAPGIAGFGAAASLCNAKECARMTLLRDFFAASVLRSMPGSALNGDARFRLCNNVNISFEGVSSGSLLLKLSAKGIYVSSGSACAAGKNRPSPVLLAMGLGRERASSSLRFSLSRYTEKRDLTFVLKELSKAVSAERGNA